MKEISFIQVLPPERSSIDRVGPGGNYLVDEHTLAHFKQGYWEPKFMDRQNYENWVKQNKGAKRM